jgi:uncharacterized protein YjiS (DUF1127 family)
MSCYLQAEVSAAPLRRLFVSALFHGAAAWLRACRRQRERRELLDFMATDHRAAADIGMKRYEAVDWANRPFWRA